MLFVSVPVGDFFLFCAEEMETTENQIGRVFPTDSFYNFPTISLR